MTRVLSGAVLLGLAVGVVWWSPAWLFLLAAEILLLLAFAEYRTIAAAAGVSVPPVAGAAPALTAAAFSGAVLGADGADPARSGPDPRVDRPLRAGDGRVARGADGCGGRSRGDLSGPLSGLAHWRDGGHPRGVPDERRCS